MTFYVSETHISHLASQVRHIADRNPRLKPYAEAVIKMSADRSRPVEYRRQLLLSFIHKHR